MKVKRCYLCGAEVYEDEPEYNQMMKHDERRGITRWKHRECHARKQRRYFDTEGGRAAIKAAQQTTRAKRRQAAGRVTKAELEDLLLTYGARCAVCGSTEDLHIDHVIPLSRGGTNTVSNLQVLCRHHNTSKGARNSDDYREDEGLMARVIGVREGKGLPKMSDITKVFGGR